MNIIISNKHNRLKADIDDIQVPAELPNYDGRISILKPQPEIYFKSEDKKTFEWMLHLTRHTSQEFAIFKFESKLIHGEINFKGYVSDIGYPPNRKYILVTVKILE